TLLEAIVLVVLVVILFLQTWRAIVIPLLAVPVSIIGSFAVMWALDFSINTLSLFGLVLSIGIVVDDAIVVVENVERHIARGLSPRDATNQAMEEVSGPIIAIGLTLAAVFVPLGFMPGLTGRFYEQCALTIAIATVISAFNSLTLSPALAALLLRPHHSPRDRLSRWIDRGLNPVFNRFNVVFARSSTLYGARVAYSLTHKGAIVGIYAVLLAATAALFWRVPGGFVPPVDKQFLVGFAQMQSGSSIERTLAVARKMSQIALAQPGVEAALAFPGLSVNGFTNSSSAAIVDIMLDPFERRRDPTLSAFAIAQSLNKQYAAQVRDATVAIFPPPAVNGLGTVGGFRMEIEDHRSRGYRELYEATQTLIRQARDEPALGPLFSAYQINVPQLDVTLDRIRAAQLGLQINDVFATLQIYLGSIYVNDFNLFGRTFQVRVQADAPFRARAESIGELKTRNATGALIPLSAVTNVAPGFGPEMVNRYNGYTAADLSGTPAIGYSSDQAQAALHRLALQTLPRGFDVEWTDLTYQQISVGRSSAWMFLLSVTLVFMTLAAQYESLSLPLSVILIIPTSMLTALAGVWLTHGDNNLFTQIGLMVLVGLACKNVILIVQFARQLEHQGHPPAAAAAEASRLRFRPILMTSVAFIAGVIPLVFSHGAGAEMRRAMGVTVFSGMLGVTILGLLLAPAFYVILRGSRRTTTTDHQPTVAAPCAPPL
ncbi:MAG TPA: efflux RND transporter permease subunit, partial [Steroidobacteraceae bacterium]